MEMTSRHRQMAVEVPIDVALTFIIRAKLPSNHPMQKATSPAMQIMYSMSLSAIFCPWKSIFRQVRAAEKHWHKTPSIYASVHTVSTLPRQRVGHEG